jgi:hypothetical protein
VSDTMPSAQQCQKCHSCSCCSPASPAYRCCLQALGPLDAVMQDAWSKKVVEDTRLTLQAIHLDSQPHWWCVSNKTGRCYSGYQDSRLSYTTPRWLIGARVGEGIRTTTEVPAKECHQNACYLWL